MVDLSALIINFEGREAKGLSKGRYDETIAGEDVRCWVLCLLGGQNMEDGDTEKYHPRSMIQDFVFLSRKRGCIRCLSLQVYNKIKYHT